MEINTTQGAADGKGALLSFAMQGDRKAPSRLMARLSPHQWRAVVAACTFGGRTPEQVIKTAIRQYLTRLGVIQEPKIAPGEASEIQAENRVTVMSRNGGILRQFVCAIPAWAFDALQFAAENDGQTIGRTCAAAIYHFAAHRGIKPPRRYEATVDKIVGRAKIADDIPDMICDEQGRFRRVLNLRAWEREAVRAVANHDGMTAGHIMAHAVRYYVTKVRGVEPPPDRAGSVENVRTARDCAFVKLHSKGRPTDAAAEQPEITPQDTAEPSEATPQADAATDAETAG